MDSTGETVCPDCGESFQKLGKHLTGGCSVSVDREMVDALIVGDGTMDNGGSGNYRLTFTTVNERYADVVAEMLGPLYQTTKSSRHEVEDRQILYSVRSICCDEMTEQYERWYPDGSRRIPDDFEITPMVMNHWYCSDGHLKTENKNPRLSIGCSYEQDRRSFVEGLFPFPTSYVGYEICFPTAITDEIVDYMGDPIPGFEYKWP